MRGLRVVFPERGRADVEEFEVPAVGPHQVLVRTEVTLISAGTELTGYLNDYGTGSFPHLPGYSHIGLVEEVGAQVSGFKPGDRVLTGSNHASHAVVTLSPDGVPGREYIQPVGAGITAEEASFAVLGSVAMHGARKAAPQLSQSAAVVGQGLVGQLLAQLLRASGCTPVIGIDMIPLRLEKARQGGTGVVIDASREDVDAAVKTATLGAGVDLACDATRNPRTLPLLMQMAALSGKVVVLGSIPGTVEISLFDPLQTKELTIIGAWQPRAPLAGHPYFPWAQWRNRQAFMDLVRDGTVKVEHLITHRVAPHDAARTYEMIRGGADAWLGVVFQW